jgi:deoxyribonuclease (pyrimidine dimer)
MVRINLIEPRQLSDQHLIAEYDEILMLISYIKKYNNIDDLPKDYGLGKGHMKFFKDKLLYLKKRHELLKKEMKKRGFKARKTISLTGFSVKNKKDWTPHDKDFKIIKARISEKLRLKPDYYRYYGEYKTLNFFLKLLRN